MRKEQIIAEIQRTAAENGGKPLGSARFEAETGVREAEWFGIHWARWGDALREAGYEPNEMQGAYDTPHLLRKIAELGLELGRIPVRGDLKLKRRRDPTFPSWNTFDRLGTKSEQVRRLAEFCRVTKEFDKVLGWCEDYLRAPDPETDGATCEQQGDDDHGYVYLVKSGRFYKIGKSNSAGRREYELGIQLPEPVKSIHAIRTDDPTGVEEYWHKRFASKRKGGEWFDLDASDVATFKRRKFM